MKKKTYIVPVLKVYRIDPVKLLGDSSYEQMNTSGNTNTDTYDTF